VTVLVVYLPLLAVQRYQDWLEMMVSVMVFVMVGFLPLVVV
jgi:hypothetical protein